MKVFVSRRTVALAAGLLFADPAAAAPLLGGGASPDVSLVRILLALIVAIAIAIFAILLVRSRAGGAALPAFLRRLAPIGQRIDLIESRRLSTHGDVCLIRFDGRDYLVLMTTGESRVLAELPAPGGDEQA